MSYTRVSSQVSVLELHGLYFLYASMAVLLGLWSYEFLPENKGISLVKAVEKFESRRTDRSRQRTKMLVVRPSSERGVAASTAEEGAKPGKAASSEEREETGRAGTVHSKAVSHVHLQHAA